MKEMVGEVSEKVGFIQDSLSQLDSQLGLLQDLSALAVDTLTILSASDGQHQEEARLARCQPAAVSWHIHPHSWTQSHRGGAPAWKSSPPSVLKNHGVVGSRHPPQEGQGHVGPKGGRAGGATEEQGVLRPFTFSTDFILAVL